VAPAGSISTCSKRLATADSAVGLTSRIVHARGQTRAGLGQFCPGTGVRILVRTVVGRGALRTATPAANGGIGQHSAAFSELGPVFLNGLQRSVNRKVQGSNPWSGAKSELECFVPCPRSRDEHQLHTGCAPIQLRMR
jgi:hypothetical protein